MDLPQATDNKHLILEDQFEGEADAERPPLYSDRQYYFWNDRYLCIHGIHDQEFWRFDVFDWLTNDSKSMRFKKSSGQFQNVMTYFLSYKFMVVIERDQETGLNRVNLVKLNWESGIFETVEHFERRANILLIITDLLNQSDFVLLPFVFNEPVIEYQDCKLVNGKIKRGNVHRLPSLHLQCSSGKLIGVDNLDQKFRIKIYNMLNNQERTFETETCPEHVQLMVNSLRQWIIDRLYATIRFRDSGSHGFMWTDAETRNWTILDFSANMEIRGLHFSNDTLIVRTKQGRTENGIFKSNVKFYEIAIRRPQPLRQKAWIRVIRKMKLEGNSNPYEAATRFLPFNTDLRSHWFEDIDNEATDKQGKDNEENNVDEIHSKRFKPN